MNLLVPGASSLAVSVQVYDTGILWLDRIQYYPA